MKELLDFLKESTNVYRTNKYIVVQDIYMDETPDGISYLNSDDTYYVRTKKADKVYESVFKERNNINGRRIKSACFKRKYIN